MSKMHIGGYLIVSLEDQLTPVQAIGELIENSVDAGATKIEVHFSPRSMTIIDNGIGCDDPMKIATPSQSGSRHETGKIGSKGIGAVQAMAAFGRTWHIDTVPHGKHVCHHLRMAWDQESPDLPEGTKTKDPAYCAPPEIRKGGTKIVVTGRQEGAATFRFETLCTELERRYRPALGNGLEIVINHFDGKKHQKRNLPNLAGDLKKFSGPISVLNGKVGGRLPFTVRYGLLNESHKTLSGCHFIFGPRVILTVNKVGKQALTSRCYIDVILGDEWQKLLSTNKSRFRYTNNLIAELDKMLGDWVKKQLEAAVNLKIRIAAGKVADMLNSAVWWLNRETSGTFGAKPRAKQENQKPRPPRPKPQPHDITPRRTRAIEGGGLFGATADKKGSALSFVIHPDAAMTTDLCRVAETDGEVTVFFNTSDRQRTVKKVLEAGRLTELYNMAVMAFAHHAMEHPTDYEMLFASIRKHNKEYSLQDDGRRDDIFFQLSNFFVDYASENENMIVLKSSAAA